MFQEDVYFNHHPGFTLRSLLGNALLEVAHPETVEELRLLGHKKRFSDYFYPQAQILMDQCSRTECVYHTIFRAGKRGSRALYSFSDVTYQFDEKNLKAFIPVGTPFEFTLNLFGDSIGFVGSFVKALKRMPSLGIGYPTPFEQVGTHHHWGSSSIERKPSFVDITELVGDPFPTPKKANVTKLIVVPLTLFRINRQGGQNYPYTESEFTFEIMIRNLIAKINGLAKEANFGTEISLESKTNLLALAEKIALKWGEPAFTFAPHLFTTGFERALPLTGGIARSFELSGELTPFLTVLGLGQSLLVGSHSTYGLGAYRLIWNELSPDRETIQLAWQHIRNKAIHHVPEHLRNEVALEVSATLESLYTEVYNQTYTPDPLLYRTLPNGREIAVATVRDKIAQRAVADKLTPLFEALFHDRSYAFRPAKGPTRAIKRVIHEITQGKCRYAAAVDIDQFFPSLSKKKLLVKLQCLPLSPKLLQLLASWLMMGGFDSYFHWKNASEGIPQGGVVSPLLSNFYLTGFDVEMAEKFSQVLIIRYCDDLLFLSPNEEKLKEALVFAEQNLTVDLSLKFNEQPSIVDLQKDSVAYMGFAIREKEIALTSEKRLEIIAKLFKIFQENSAIATVVATLQEKSEQYAPYYGAILESAWQPIFKDLVRSALQQQSVHNESAILKGLGWLKEKSPAKPKNTSVKSVEARILARQRTAIEERYLLANIIIDEPGRYLAKRRTNVTVLEEGKIIQQVPAHTLKHIFVTSNGIGFSSNLVGLLAKYKIPVTFMDNAGTPISSLLPSVKTISTRLQKQLECSQQNHLYYATLIIQTKLANQLNLLKYWKKSRQDLESKLDRWIAAVEVIFKRLVLSSKTNLQSYTIEKLMLEEAQAAAHYWEAFQAILSRHSFPGRRHQGARDTVNQLLNYGYGFLYSKVQVALVKAGLNPYIGFLHQSDRGAPTLVFDCVEPFRQPFVDREVVALLNRGKMIPQQETDRLDNETRKRAIEHFIGAFCKTEIIQKSVVTRDQMIEASMRELSHSIEDKSIIWKPYHWKKW